MKEKIKYMAKPIKETPVLKGKDAQKFLKKKRKLKQAKLTPIHLRK